MFFILLIFIGVLWAFLVAQMVKNLSAMWDTWVWSLGWEDLLEKGMATYSVFLPGEFHGQRSWVGYSPWGCKESDTTERLTHRNRILLGLPWRSSGQDSTTLLRTQVRSVVRKLRSRSIHAVQHGRKQNRTKQKPWTLSVKQASRIKIVNEIFYTLWFVLPFKAMCIFHIQLLPIWTCHVSSDKKPYVVSDYHPEQCSSQLLW